MSFRRDVGAITRRYFYWSLLSLFFHDSNRLLPDYRCKPIINYTRMDASMPFRSASVDVRTRKHVGVGHAGNVIDLLRFREENRYKEQSADVLLRNFEPFVVGERVPRFVTLILTVLLAVKERACYGVIAFWVICNVIIYYGSLETFAFVTFKRRKFRNSLRFKCKCD